MPDIRFNECDGGLASAVTAMTLTMIRTDPRYSLNLMLSKVLKSVLRFVSGLALLQCKFNAKNQSDFSSHSQIATSKSI